MTSLPLVAPEELGLSPARLARLSRVLAEEVAGGRVPGAVALIARRGKLGYFDCFGSRDAASGAPMAKDSIFRIYSMTKPVTSVAAMMLWEEGRFLLDAPIAEYLPELAHLEVAGEQAGGWQRLPPTRAVTVQDLLRHTSGITYEFRGSGPVQRLYMGARVYSRGQSNAELVAALGKLPLLHQPGTRWEYGRSTDVVGRLIEVLSGQSLSAFFEQRIFAPLGMVDTAFHVAPQNLPRLAEAFAKNPESGAGVQLLDVRSAPRFESGGAGLVSTAGDYVRFLQLLLDGGVFGGRRFLGRKTIELMTADHLGGLTGAADLLLPGHGFGLGFAVRLAAGISALPGSVGQYFWGGLAGTTFWVDPQEKLVAILMIQAPAQRAYYQTLFRDLVYSAIDD